MLSNPSHRKEPLLCTPSDQDFTVPDEILRKTAEHTEVSDAGNPFILKEQTFRQQYANIYFIRLTKLRDATLEAARERWSGLPGTSPPHGLYTQCKKKLTIPNSVEKIEYVSKVLDVQAGKLCYIIGTVYMDMPLKPNILEDITKEVSIGVRIEVELLASRLLKSGLCRTILSLNHHRQNMSARMPQWPWRMNLEELF